MKKNKICPVCNKEFETNNHQKYCSVQCREIATSEKKKEYLRKYYIKNKEKIINRRQLEKETWEKTCPVCGKTFITSDRKRIYCSLDCRVKKQNQDVVKENNKRKTIYQKTCPICKKTFTTTDSKKKYCSNECYRASTRKRLRDQSGDPEFKKYCSQKNMKYLNIINTLGMSITEFNTLKDSGADVRSLLIEKGLTDAIKVCKSCGKEFISFDNKRKYCDHCKR